MAKTTAQDIKNEGFSYEGFGVESAEFDAYLENVISEQSALIKIEVGSVYDSSDVGISTFLKRAELCRSCASLLTIRINVFTQSGDKIDGLDMFKIRRSIEQYLSEAEQLIDRTRSGMSFSKGFSSSAVTYED